MLSSSVRALSARRLDPRDAAFPSTGVPPTVPGGTGGRPFRSRPTESAGPRGIRPRAPADRRAADGRRRGGPGSGASPPTNGRCRRPSAPRTRRPRGAGAPRSARRRWPRRTRRATSSASRTASEDDTPSGPSGRRVRHPGVRAVRGDVGPHRLGAQDRHPDPLVVVGDGEPLGERHRGVLRDRVAHRPDLGEQARRGRGVEEVALAAGDHRRQHGARGMDVRQDVHLPQGLEDLVGLLDPSLGHEAGVRAEQVDRPVARLRRAHEVHDRRLVPDVDGRRGPTDGGGHGRGRPAVTIGHHHVASAGRPSRPAPTPRRCRSRRR